MRDFTPSELEAVRAAAAAGKSKTETGRSVRIAFANFAANCEALGIKFQKTGMDHAKRVFTPDELRTVQTLAAAGFGKTEVYERLTIGHDSFKRLCAEHGIVFQIKHNPPPPVTNKREISDEDAAIFRSMAERGATRHQLAKRFGVSLSTVGRFFRDLNIPADKAKRAPKAKGKRTSGGAPDAKAKGRNPMKDLNTWRPMADLTTLDAAVTSLRTRFCPVHAEDTARKRFETPKPYSPETLFRIGSLRDVTAEQLMAMAGEVRRAA